MLGTAKHQPAAPAVSRESDHRPVLRIREPNRYRSHGELERYSACGSAPRCSWNNNQRKLHLVELPWRYVAGDSTEYQCRSGMERSKQPPEGPRELQHICRRSASPVQFLERCGNTAVFKHEIADDRFGMASVTNLQSHFGQLSDDHHKPGSRVERHERAACEPDSGESIRR